MELQLQKLTQKFEQPQFVSYGAAIKIKQAEQETLDKEKEKFFARGGEIKTYSPTSVLIVPAAKPKFSQEPNKKRKKVWSSGQADNSSLVAYHSRTKPEKRRMNITEKKLATCTKWTLNIAGIFYGSFETEELAVAFRDEKRKLLNMPVAEY